MKTGEKIVKLAWILLVVMAVGAAAILLNQPSTNISPLSSSYSPGGAAAFAELLRREGYNVEIVDTIPVAPQKDALVVMFLQREQIPLDTSEKASDDDEDSKPVNRRDTDSKGGQDAVEKMLGRTAGLPLKFVTDQVKAGGSAVVLGYSEGEISKVFAGESTVDDSSGRHYSLTALTNGDANELDLSEADASFPAWRFSKSSNDTPFANIDSINGGMAVVIPQGELALNSFIDQKDNAKFLVDAVHVVAPENRKIQLIDGAVLGAGQMGLIEILGPWAHGIELQIILLGIVIVYSLGKRFGIADETARVQRGARDLLDGIADTYSRSRAGKAALALVTQEADRGVRRYLKFPADASIRKRNEMLPESVAQALSACEYANTQDPSAQESLELARRLETELEVFLSRRRSTANRRRRRVKSP